MESDWIESVLKPALASFLGTLAAALVIFLVGVAAGVIDDVSARTWISVGSFAALGAATAGIATYVVRERSTRRQRRSEEVADELDEATHMLLSIHFGDGRELDEEEQEKMLRGILAASQRVKAKHPSRWPWRRGRDADYSGQ